jgi:uncharacterized protein YecT (DUF1311 family)
MHRFMTAVFVGGFLLFSGALAAAQEGCPKNSLPISPDDLQTAPTCAAAHALHLFCNYGATGDRGLTTIVVGKCEAVFLKKLTPDQKRHYNARVKDCGVKAERAYRNDGGTMALAEGAFCEEKAAADFARDVTNAASPPTVKASFDCRKAETLLELAICSSDKTGAADIELSKAYRAASQPAAPDVRQMLKESELGWLDYAVSACLEISSMNEKQKTCVQKVFAERAALIPRCMAKAGDDRAKCLNGYKDDAGK